MAMTRSAFLLLAILLTGAAAPATTLAQPAKSSAMKRGTADTALAPLSVSLVEKGRTLLAERQYDAAIDRFETALAVDPRNIHAYIGLAEAASGQGLPGKSVRFYREALGIDPNNREALAGQGVALVQRGARPRAEANLERLKTLCGGPCPEAARLQTALNAPAPKDNALAATASPPKP
jgi:Tfp pilus assembly protein PilF